MFTRLHQSNECSDIGGVFAQYPRGDLPVKDLGRYIGVIGRCLAPTDMTIRCSYFNKGYELICKSFKLRNFSKDHPAAFTNTGISSSETFTLTPAPRPTASGLGS